ncbi:MAG: MBL fold metallo-hydrolase [Pseudolabrys sp.]
MMPKTSFARHGCWAVATILAGLALATNVHAQGKFTVTLLGTSAPPPLPDRFGPSTLVQAGDQVLVFDAGRGAAIRLWQMKVPLGKIDALFLTHYHSDHTVGIPDLWLTGWLPTGFGRRTTPLHVIGPPGAKNLMDNLQKAYTLDISMRHADENLPMQGIAVNVDEFSKDGVVYDKDGVKVIAFKVDHGDLVKPAYGYRIEYGGHAAVISGDTRYNQNVIKYGTGADLLVHEVASVRLEMMAIPAIQRIIAHHTTPKEAGMVFANAKPKLAAYTHLVLLGEGKNPPPSLDDVVAETRQTYSGPLVVGADLMSFDIGDTVTVRPWKPVAATKAGAQ